MESGMEPEPDISKPRKRAADDADPGDWPMFWFNLIGFSIAAILLGSFFFLYGPSLIGLLVFTFNPEAIPDR